MCSSEESNVITRPGASALRPTPMSERPERTRAVVAAAMERADRSLSGAFEGVTADGTVREGLFPVLRTNVSVQPIIEAADRFLRSLSPGEREAVRFDIANDYAWRSWHNMHFFFMRHGLLLHDLTEGQRQRALDLLGATMSAEGYSNARDIMRLNEHAGELTGRVEEFGEFYYWISLFGDPSSSAPWGWQIDGHHLCVNCLILGDQIVLTPDFRGSEPVHAKSGKYAGVRVFAEEESRGLAFMQGLDASQRKAATLSAAPPREVITTAQVDNFAIGQKGLAFSNLSARQRDQFVELIATYTGRIRPGHAEVRLDEVKQHLDETRFAWMGGCDDTSAFYYRIFSPVILVEFDHLPGIVYDNDNPSRRHIHSIVRTPNGNDYGRDLLREHYRTHDHANPSSPHRRGHE